MISTENQQKPPAWAFGVVSILIAFISALVLIYTSELWLAVTSIPHKYPYIISKRLENPQTVPATTAQIILMKTQMQGLQLNGGERVVPFGGISDAPTVFCQEEDGMLQYHSDRFGFFNNDRIWEEETWQVAAIGDSFVQGACVPVGTSMVDHIRRTYPKTANLGSFGNGPLANLGTLIEYALVYKPKVVLWFYVSNDLNIDLEMERQNPILTGYLNSGGVTQNLRARQNDIDHGLRQFLDAELNAEASHFEYRAIDFLKIAKLQKFSRRLTRGLLRPPAPLQPAVADYDHVNLQNIMLFEKILLRASTAVSDYGGEFRLVIIPDSRMFNRSLSNQNGATPFDFVMDLEHRASSAGIRVINLYPEFSDKFPMQFFTALDGYYGHFNRRGYATAGEAVTRSLRQSLNLPMADIGRSNFK